MDGVGFADTEGDGLMTGASIGVGTCVPVFAEFGTEVSTEFSVVVGVGVVSDVVDHPEPAPPPLPDCGARSTLTVASAETLPSASVCVKVRVWGALIPVPTHDMETEKVPPLQVVVVGLVAR